MFPRRRGPEAPRPGAGAMFAGEEAAWKPPPPPTGRAGLARSVV